MSRRKKELPTLEMIEITDVAAEGKALARVEDLVVFVPWVVPGDVVDLKLLKKKHHYAEAEAVKFHRLSDKRATPFCPHFGTCGGCKWQMLPYEEQLRWKQKQVMDALERIGKVELPECQPIMGSRKTQEYRNKLEFGCSNKRWLTKAQMEEAKVQTEDGAVGYHAGGSWDKILPIEECHLMDDENNRLRNDVRDYALAQGLTFFDAREHTGLLRGMMIRLGADGAVMLLVQFCIQSDAEQEQAMLLMEHLRLSHPEVTSLLWVNNTKFNDTFGDLPIEVYSGEDHIFLRMEDLRFKVGPKSFYQTNTEQAYELYSVVRDFVSSECKVQSAKLPSNSALDPKGGLLQQELRTQNSELKTQNSELRTQNSELKTQNSELKTQNSELASPEAKPLVYDLYTGTGTIANFVARGARRVIGIEYVPEAIEDAKANSELNGIGNTEFFAGDMKDILTDDFITRHGRPDIIITDPPRAGMHGDVVQTILRAAPRRIVYVSCNPATQARDLQLLDAQYRVVRIQPVDMFPHTQHVENVVLLERK